MKYLQEPGELLMDVVRAMVNRTWHEAHHQGRAWQLAQPGPFMIVTEEQRDIWVKNIQEREAKEAEES